MFQTRPDGPDTPPIFQTLIDIATFMNAYTNWDMTHYRTTVARREPRLDAQDRGDAHVLRGGSARPFGCSTVQESEFEREREVVRNEIRARLERRGLHRPARRGAAMYPQGHAYQRMIGGNDEQIASASLKDACEFMKKYYAPERATRDRRGRRRRRQDRRRSSRSGSARSRSATAAPRVEVEAVHRRARAQEIEADVERPSVWIGWPLPAGNTPEGEAAQFGIGSAFGRHREQGAGVRLRVQGRAAPCSAASSRRCS